MPLCFCILHSTSFWFKRRGFAVINIDIINYLVVKNVILRMKSHHLTLHQPDCNFAGNDVKSQSTHDWFYFVLDGCHTAVIIVSLFSEEGLKPKI